ncbi:unnamed protein product, partial [Polarella glacialis]
MGAMVGTSMILAAVVTATASQLSAHTSVAEHGAGFSLPSRTPLFDYDCVSQGRRRRPPIVDWVELYEEVQTAVSDALEGGPLPRPPRRSGRLLLIHLEQALKECPLGMMTLAVIHYFLAKDDDEQAEVLLLSAGVIEGVARHFPLHVVGTSRWPVFEALHLFAGYPEGTDHATRCDGIEDGVINWSEARVVAQAWSRSFPLGDFQADSSVAKKLVEAMDYGTMDAERSRLECPMGLLFFVSLRAMVTAVRFTSEFTGNSQMLDSIVREFGLLPASYSGWPIGQILMKLSDINKGKKYVVRNYKYVRRFADLDLRLEELSPLVQPPLTGGAATVSWRSKGARSAVAMGRLSQWAFQRVVRRKAAGTRPILHQALSAMLDATGSRGCEDGGTGCCFGSQQVAGGLRQKRRRPPLARRHVALTLLYGSSWSVLLGRTVRHLGRLGFSWPLLVVSIGNDAYQACRRLARASNSIDMPKVTCWRPDTQSQVHRFTIIHILLHLGVDVFYFDMDTFFFRNPLPEILGKAGREGLDTIWSTHGDGDCVNIGVFYIRSTWRTTIWFSQFLDWYHDHQYEIDQRGLDVLLGSPRRIPEGQLDISFPPTQLQKVKVGVLDDFNK